METSTLVQRIEIARQASAYWGRGIKSAEDLHEAVGVIDELVRRLKVARIGLMSIPSQQIIGQRAEGLWATNLTMPFKSMD